MKRYFIILIAFTTLLFNQDRSLIFNTGSPPDFTNGYTIDIFNSVANKFTVSNNYVLEAMVFYMTASSINSTNINVSIRADNNGVPGELLSEFKLRKQSTCAMAERSVVSMRTGCHDLITVRTSFANTPKSILGRDFSTEAETFASVSLWVGVLFAPLVRS